MSEIKEREQRKWWAVTDRDVQEVTGFSCAPFYPETWWCPEVGFSGTEGYAIFMTEREALDKAIQEAERDLAELQQHLQSLQNRRKRLS